MVCLNCLGRHSRTFKKSYCQIYTGKVFSWNQPAKLGSTVQAYLPWESWVMRHKIKWFYFVSHHPRFTRQVGCNCRPLFREVISRKNSANVFIKTKKHKWSCCVKWRMPPSMALVIFHNTGLNGSFLMRKMPQSPVGIFWIRRQVDG
jgi:hypothetical protein